MKKLVLSLFTLSVIFQSCSNDDDGGSANNNVTAPETYVFTRNGNSTVSFSGQTTRIQMAEEIVSALKDPLSTEPQIDAMFAHEQGGDNFLEAGLNASDKNVRSKVAASTDYFSANSTDATAIKADFDTWIEEQVNIVFPAWNLNASSGVAGALLQSSGTVRYLNGKGLEYNQAFAKGLIGGLMLDQILNNYLSDAVLDAGTNKEDNDNEVLESGKNYTTMEHKWDEAYGYLFGNEDNPETPELGADQFLNEYLDRVAQDPDFKNLDVEIYEAFKLGRAAITEGVYTLRDDQVDIIREKLSLVPAVRAVYYLQAAKPILESDRAAAFHALSEAYGFIYSLQFTRNNATGGAYFSKKEVDLMLEELMVGDGFWDLNEEKLDILSQNISAKFDFTVEAAADASN
ncbi:DUF4856 domain-containing protein [Pseudotamlana carrageenivorans]|uniref:DUF4856 domain-containing protein n=1 Tax=Pseudotamlana carrageenivorans TaxID=2069432 RepID=A0A2I7SDV4_9FLAO|nr:DUF4856 domain-containing protein [Tamlana carrageenivorans]AUS04075.1 DUF4856 domain-containing protein [Tamlana carrageenivorans]